MNEVLIFLTDVINSINRDNLLSAKLQNNLFIEKNLHSEIAQNFLSRYMMYLKNENLGTAYIKDCYRSLIEEGFEETLYYFETGEYFSRSANEINKAVYNNQGKMKARIHALLLTQYLWKHQYETYCFFVDQLASFKNRVMNYLEIGVGHGLYLFTAMNLLKDKSEYSCIDISQSAIDFSNNLIKNEKVNYINENIFDFRTRKSFDFICMGEMLEHVEDPVKLLNIIKGLLTDKGKCFLTVAMNAPAIDHVYLFRNEKEVHSVIQKSGFDIEFEVVNYSKSQDDESLRTKTPSIYAAVLKKNNKNKDI